MSFTFFNFCMWLILICYLVKRGRDHSVCSSSSRISAEIDEEENFKFGVNKDQVLPGISS